LVFPFLLGAIWRSPKRIVFAIAVGCLLFAFIPWAIAYLYLDPEIHRATAVEPIPANDWAVFIRSSPLFRVHEFILGIAFARLTLDDDPGGNIRKRFHRFPSLSLILSALVLIIVVIDRIPRLLIHAGILDAFYLLLIAHLLAGRGGLVRILESRVFVRLGEASYGIYILHIPIRNLMLSASDEAGTTLAGLPFLTLYIPIVIASSLLAFQWIEEPARRAINNRFQHHHSTHRPAGVR
jgi:peptidoglycan/LPS O-acetylase OafA/YrhL